MVQPRLVAFLVAAFLSSTPLVRAQVSSPTAARQALSGIVLDPTGAAVPAAEVTVTGRDGRPVVTSTDPLGHFALTTSAAGPFTVTVVAPGFAPAVTVDVDVTKPLSLSVVPAAVQEYVDVVSSARPAAVTSTATRTATPLLHVPQAIDIVGAGVLREQAAMSMGDALKNVPGVNANLGEGRRDQFLIRGFSALNDTLLDGTRDDAPYYRDVATVERIEVLKGPAAALFGRGSSGGVINRVLKAPRPDAAISEGSVSVGALGTRRFTGDLGRSLGDSFAFRVAAAAEDSTSFRDDTFLRRVTVAPVGAMGREGDDRTRAVRAHRRSSSSRSGYSVRGRPASAGSNRAELRVSCR